VKYAVFISTILLLVSCKKATQRTCLKSYGEDSQLEIPIDSVSNFMLYKNLNYHIYQDTLRKIIIRGGANVIQMVDVRNISGELSIQNKNKCNFLRDYDKHIQVEIHYPFYHRIYSETEDSLVFKDTIYSSYLYVDQALGGGNVILHMEGGTLVLIARNGVGSYEVSGHVNHADLRIQNGASGNARQLKSPHFELDHNSTGKLFVNLDSAQAIVAIKGTGDVFYSGDPDTIIVNQTGVGEIIKE
jgi:hypothetical protein